MKTPGTVFFRDDDVAGLTEPLRALVDLFLDEQVPCNFQVIPALLSAEAAAWLRARHAEAPALVRLNQHGFAHRRRAPGGGWAEFGMGRPYRDQLRDLEAGRRRLRSLLGEAFSDRVFSPPWHRYDGNTLRALDATGFAILSARVATRPRARWLQRVGRTVGAAAIRGHPVSYHGQRLPGVRLTEISCGVDVDEDFDHRGDRRLKEIDRLDTEVERLARRHRVVGINLHHAQQRGPRSQVPGILRRWIQQLRARGVMFRSIEEIAATGPEAEPGRPPSRRRRPAPGGGEVDPREHP